MIRRIVICVVLLIFISATAYATVKLKIAVVNPSSTREKTTPVRFDLPRGIEPEHIVEKGDMEVGYDFDKATYYVYGTLTLEPSEKRTLMIELQDIWLIPEKEIRFLKYHTFALMEKLEDTAHKDIGGELSAVITKKLDGIARTQKEKLLNVREKMNVFYENTETMAAVKGDIGMLENLVLDVGGIVEERVEVPETLAISVSEEKGIGPWEVIEMKVAISNPSETKKKTADLKYDLPQEVIPGSVLDANGLELGYDFGKECFYVFQDDVELEPGEQKVFIIKIKDIWRVPDVELDALKKHTKNLLLLIKGSENFEQGEILGDKIFFNLAEINTSQNLKVPPPEHIAFYRDNEKTFKIVKEDVAKLEKLATQAGSTPGVTIAKAEREKGGGKEVKRPKGYEGIAFIARTIFRGKAPTVATTWKIIFTIIGFVGAVSAVFFALWQAQVRRERRRAEERKKQSK